MITLRHYQTQCKEEVYGHFKRGLKRVIVAMPTGSGKSLLFTSFTDDAFQCGMYVVLIVKRRELISQASKHFSNLILPHGVYMANHYRYNPNERIQICSVDTLDSRKIYPHADKKNVLVIIDECFSADTEILTEKGFIPFPELKDERVAQFNSLDWRIDFVSPSRKIEKNYSGKMIEFHSDNIYSCCVTPNHEMLTLEGKVLAKDLKTNYCTKMFLGGLAAGSDNHLKNIEKLAIAYQADGSMHYRRSDGSFLALFSFKKKRKINAFMDLMKSGGFKHNILNPYKEKFRSTVVMPQSVSKDISSFFELKNLSVGKCRDIIEYMNIWDGHVASKSTYLYTTTNKVCADFYQSIATMSGYKTKLVKVADNRSDKFSDIYRLFINKKQITSAQTIEKREVDYSGRVYCVTVPTGNIITRRNGKVIITGNCHDAGSSQYSSVFDAYRNHNIIGLTATPFSDNSMWEAYSKPIEAITLMNEGFLVPDKIYVPDMIDVSGVKSYKGEYANNQLAMACSKSSVIGDVIKNWRIYGQGKRTILFAVNIEHSKLLCAKFNAAGIKAMHCDAKSTQMEREIAINALKKHHIDVLCNVNIFSTGVDIPEIECISFCRPTKSITYWIQAVGRGLRPAPWIDKKECVIIDHAGNALRHGSVYTPREISLEPRKKSVKDPDDISIRYCKQCFYVFLAHEPSCPDCGYTNPKQERKINEEEGDLVEYKMSPEEKEKLKEASFMSQFYKLSHVAKRNNFKDNWLFYQLIKTQGKEDCAKYGHKIDFPRSILLRG